MGFIISMIGILIFNLTSVIWGLYCMNEILNHGADFWLALSAGITGGTIQMVVGGIAYFVGNAIDG